MTTHTRRRDVAPIDADEARTILTTTAACAALFATLSIVDWQQPNPFTLLISALYVIAAVAAMLALIVVPISRKKES